LVRKVLREKASLVQSDCKAIKVSLGRKVFQVQRASPALPESEAQLAMPGRPGLKASPALLANKGLRALSA
jgi:hypothetical protein